MIRHKRYNLIGLIRWLAVISLIALSTIIATFQGISTYQRFQRDAAALRDTYLTQRKDLIKREVDRVTERISFRHATSYNEARNMARDQATRAHTLAEHLHQINPGVATSVDHQHVIADTINAMPDGVGNSSFIIQANGTTLPDHLATMPGNATRIPPPDVIATIQSTLRTASEGFIEYEAPISNTRRHSPTTIVYVKYFEPYNWIIGSQVPVAAMEIRAQAQILDQITQAPFEEGEYIFAGQWDGISLAGPARGQNMYNVEDVNGVKIVQELIATAQAGGGYVEYVLPKFEGQRPAPKISYVQGIPAWEWYVGAGLYIDAIEQDIAALQAARQQEFRTEVRNIILVTSAVIALALLMLYWLDRRLSRDLDMFVTFFKQAATSNAKIDRTQLRFAEFYEIAGSANTMLVDKMAAQQSLQDEKEQLAVTLRSISDGVITTDVAGQVLLMNRAAETLTGWQQNDAVGEPIETVFEIVDADTNQPAPDPVKQVLTTGLVIDIPHQLLLISRTGSHHNIEKSAAPIRDSSSRIRGVVVVFRDVTERQAFEAEQEKLRKLEAVGVLAGGIAHDFNNLLTGLFGNLEMAKMFLEPEHRSHKFLVSAANAMDNAISLTKQLLTFAKGGDPVKETVDLQALLVETGRFCLRGSEVGLETRIAADLWFLEADRGQLSQVITNLLINAKQAMPHGGTITLSAGNIIREDGRFVEIKVRDEGVGIAPQHLDKLFDPYFTTKENGSGLGLATTHSIVRKHQGTIAVESRLHHGTTFTIQLPATSATATPENQPDRPNMTGTDTRARVLLLDDEEMVREVAGAMLTQLGCDVTLTAEGQEAVDRYAAAQAKGQPFDVVIVDLTIPGGMGGQAASQAIHNLNPDAKIIVSSGYATDPVMAEYKQHGFSGIAVKPYRFTELKTVLQQMLAN